MNLRSGVVLYFSPYALSFKLAALIILALTLCGYCRQLEDGASLRVSHISLYINIFFVVDQSTSPNNKTMRKSRGGGVGVGTRSLGATAALLALIPRASHAEKDDSYYMAGSGNPNVKSKMYWKDADNVLQDLSSFSSLYVQFHDCAWTWMYNENEEADNDVDENGEFIVVGVHDRVYHGYRIT